MTLKRMKGKYKAEQRLRRGSFYVLQMRDGKYLVEFKGRQVYYRYAERRERYVFGFLAREYTGRAKAVPKELTFHPDSKDEYVVEKVARDDLPTYVGWSLLSPKFSEILSNKNRLRIKLRRKRLNKRMLHA